METKRLYIRVCACRHVAAPDHPEAGVLIPSLGEGSGYYTGGSETPWEARNSAGIRTSTGGPEPPAARAERLLLPEHVVLPDLSQPGDGSGTVVG